jgi:hypothetical protein
MAVIKSRDAAGASAGGEIVAEVRAMNVDHAGYLNVYMHIVKTAGLDFERCHYMLLKATNDQLI